MATNVKQEIWLGIVIQQLRRESGFLNEIQSYDSLVDKNDTIHLSQIGVSPAVLINNTSYPINTVAFEDEDIPVKLKKYETENTAISDDLLHAAGYDVIAAETQNHTDSLAEKILDHSAYCLAPDYDTATTPVLLTSGVIDPNNNNYKRMTAADLLDAEKRASDNKIPRKNRVLLLHEYHLADLMLEDRNLAARMINTNPSEPFQLYSFKTFIFSGTAKYDKGTVQKRAFGALPNVDRVSSQIIYTPDAFRATGSTKMYYQDASVDTKYRESTIGFRRRHICLPKVLRGGMMAIVSA